MFGTCCECNDSPWLNKTDVIQEIEHFKNKYFDCYVCNFHFGILEMVSETLDVINKKSNEERKKFFEEVGNLFEEGMEFLTDESKESKLKIQ
jgi:regulator of sigma D